MTINQTAINKGVGGIKCQPHNDIRPHHNGGVFY